MVPLLSVGHYSPVVPGGLTASFFALTPNRVLDAVEVGGLRSTGRCLPLRAFENRVYEVELEDERRLVVKFHRPGRWSRQAIVDYARSNVLWKADGPMLVDFDDFITGPPAQDLWLLAPGNTEEARRARWEIVEGYEIFRELDRSTLELCEPMRALRIIYMSAWIARRWDDPSFPVAFPTFRDHRYWMHEYEALIAIAEALGP